jgi:HKD family nuclease
MIVNRLDIQSRARNGRVIKTIIEAAKISNFDSLLVAVAYVTEKGARILVHELALANPNWIDVEKNWLVSIDYGTSEPNALRFLRSLPNSSVRIYEAEDVLSRGLKPSIAFHPKIYIFDDNSNNSITLVSGSANLTGGGLYTNNEQISFSHVSKPISSLEKKSFSEISQVKSHLISLFELSSICTEDIIADYETVRNSKNNNSSVESSSADSVITVGSPSYDVSEAISLTTAANMWVQAGRVTRNRGARHGNQIDLQRGVRRFFGFSDEFQYPVYWSGDVNIKFDGQVYERNLRIGANGMEKLSLPTIDAPRYEAYDHKTLLFTRIGLKFFNMHIGTTEEANDWEAKSLKQGEVYTLRGGRKYGLF